MGRRGVVTYWFKLVTSTTVDSNVLHQHVDGGSTGSKPAHLPIKTHPLLQLSISTITQSLNPSPSPPPQPSSSPQSSSPAPPGQTPPTFHSTHPLTHPLAVLQTYDYQSSVIVSILTFTLPLVLFRSRFLLHPVKPRLLGGTLDPRQNQHPQHQSAYPGHPHAPLPPVQLGGCGGEG